MISEAAGAGVICQDVQQAIESEMRYRLGEGDASWALSRWQKELLLLVIHITGCEFQTPQNARRLINV